MITSAGLCWDGEARVDGRKFVSDVTLFQQVRVKLQKASLNNPYKVGRPSDCSLSGSLNHSIPIV